MPIIRISDFLNGKRFKNEIPVIFKVIMIKVSTLMKNEPPIQGILPLSSNTRYSTSHNMRHPSSRFLSSDRRGRTNSMKTIEEMRRFKEAYSFTIDAFKDYCYNMPPEIKNTELLNQMQNYMRAFEIFSKNATSQYHTLASSYSSLEKRVKKPNFFLIKHARHLYQSTHNTLLCLYSVIQNGQRPYLKLINTSFSHMYASICFLQNFFSGNRESVTKQNTLLTEIKADVSGLHQYIDKLFQTTASERFTNFDKDNFLEKMEHIRKRFIILFAMPKNAPEREIAGFRTAFFNGSVNLANSMIAASEFEDKISRYKSAMINFQNNLLKTFEELYINVSEVSKQNS